MTPDFNFEKTNRFYGVKLACLQNMTKIASQEVIELDTLKGVVDKNFEAVDNFHGQIRTQHG